MRWTKLFPKAITRTGGILIIISGIVSALLGAKVDAPVYDVYAGGNLGHVGILAGVIAIIIGIVILIWIVPLYDSNRRLDIFLASILTVILGHLGGKGGVVYVGTIGVFLCYFAGIFHFWRQI